MCWLTTLGFSVFLALATMATTENQRRHDAVYDIVADLDLTDDKSLVEQLLRKARVEAVKRSILQQLGLTEAPRPSTNHNRSSTSRSSHASVMAAHRYSLAHSRQPINNDVIEDVSRTNASHGDEGSAKQFYSFKGHIAPVSGCNDVSEYTLLFRISVPLPESPDIETVVTSAVLRLYVGRLRRTRRLRSNSPSDDIARLTVYHIDDESLPSQSVENASSRVVRLDEARVKLWEEFDLTSVVKRHVAHGGGKALGPLRLRVTFSGGGAALLHQQMVFGSDWCKNDESSARELRHRHHPTLVVLTRVRSTVGRRSRRSVLPHIAASSEEETLCTANDGETRCCRRPLWISFHEIGWDNWILEPDGWQAYYCYGDCPAGHRTAHNHAAIRDLVRSTIADGGGNDDWKRLVIPRLTCTATRLGPLALKHIHNDRQVVSVFQDMIVEQCRCA